MANKTRKAEKAAVAAKANKRERQERIIYDSYYSEEKYEDAERSFRECNELPEEAEVSEDDIWDEYNFLDDQNWEDEKVRLEELFDECPEGFLIKGAVGRWDGPAEAGQIVHSVSEMSKAWTDCEYVKLYDVDSHFFIQASHHDGTNRFEMKQLTKRGAEYADNHRWDMDPSELHTKLWESSTYTKLPNYAHRIYGCPKREAKREPEKTPVSSSAA